jgi:hypothetical protein
MHRLLAEAMDVLRSPEERAMLGFDESPSTPTS